MKPAGAFGVRPGQKFSSSLRVSGEVAIPNHGGLKIGCKLLSGWGEKKFGRDEKSLWLVRAEPLQLLIGAGYWAIATKATLIKRDLRVGRQKSARNLKKHGIFFEEAATVFFDPLAITFLDPDHSTAENREITIGHTMKQRLAFVSHCERCTRIRLISARVATNAERRQYEEGFD